MAPHQTKSIPEALLKLKAALEEGKRDGVPSTSKDKEPHSGHNNVKKPESKSPARTETSPKWKNKTAKETSPENHNTYKTNHSKHEAAPLEKTEHKPKPHIESKPIPLSRNERVKTALAWLYETFPNLFKMNERLPLKIGITQDVAAWIDARKKLEQPSGDVVEIQTEAQTPFTPSKTAVRDAITVYTNTPLYQKALLNNDKRYDLDGQAVGVVEEQQKAHADQRNTLIEAAIQVQVKKREELRERRKMIAEAWRTEKEAKKDPDLASDPTA
ncbi:MAG: ProQ/FinO family protein [Pseudomonadota bacterium]